MPIVALLNCVCQWKDPEAACGLRQGKRTEENPLPEVIIGRNVLWDLGFLRSQTILTLTFLFLRRNSKIGMSTRSYTTDVPKQVRTAALKVAFPHIPLCFINAGFLCFPYLVSPLIASCCLVSVLFSPSTCLSMTASGVPAPPSPPPPRPSIQPTRPASCLELNSNTSPSLCRHRAKQPRLLRRRGFTPLCKLLEPPALQRKTLSRPLPLRTTLFKVPPAFRQQDTAAPYLCV